MTRFKIEFELSGNETAVHAVVKRALDHVGFTDLQFTMTKISGGFCVKCGVDVETAGPACPRCHHDTVVVIHERGDRSRSKPIGRLVPVDLYVCEQDKLSVEVERVPSADDYEPKALMQMEWGDPACPVCEREMTRVGRKLRKTH